MQHSELVICQAGTIPGFMACIAFEFSAGRDPVRLLAAALEGTCCRSASLPSMLCLQSVS
jgi:hypothetical protein